jgi:NitT/TauT family transport system permease protein
MSDLEIKSPGFVLPNLSGKSGPFPLVKSVNGHAIGATAIPVLLILLWQLGSSLHWIDAAIMPSPIDCAISWKRWIIGAAGGRSLDSYNGTWLRNALYSLERVVEGFGIACAIGIPAGILIGWFKSFSILDPTIQMLRPVPITAWLPFSIALFGIQNKSALFLIALGAFYPIVVSASQGARDTAPLLVRAAQMLGARSWTMLARVVVPSAMPTIFVGLRLGVGASWTAVVIAEMVSVKTGLGYVLWDAYYLGRMDIVIADMVSIGLLGFASDLIIVWLRARMIKWRH